MGIAVKLKEQPRCNYLNQDGKRCRRRSGIVLRVHLEPELYKFPTWVEINLCPEHLAKYIQ